MPVYSKYYRGNPRLKSAFVKMDFTEDQMKEWVKCSEDPEYFIENFVKIVTLDGGLVDFKLYPYQKEIIQSCEENRFIIAKLARQLGKSTSVAAYFLWCVLFKEDYSVAILANKLSTAKEILRRIQLMYMNLPFWLQQGIVEWNKQSVILENGSMIIAASTSSDSIRGFTFNAILLDEFAMVPGTIAEEFFASVFPTISSGKSSKLFILSTPKGMNHYYRLWTDAVNGINGFVTHSAKWDAVPTRDAAWEKSQREKLGRLFSQEHECEFLGSVHTLIDSHVLSSIPLKDPIFENEDFCAWEEPIRKNIDDPDSVDHMYLISVDTSEGLGQDYSAFSVIDITEYPHRMVARYRSNEVSPVILPQYIYDTAIKYNNAFVLIENASTGEMVANALYMDFEYENILRTAVKGKSQVISAGNRKGSRLGLKPSATIKAVGCSSLKTLVESHAFVFHDDEVFAEFTTFVRSGRSYKAEPGSNDDLVMTLVNYGWLTSQQYFKDLTNITLREKVTEGIREEMDSTMLPYAFFFDDKGEGEGETEVFNDMLFERRTAIEQDNLNFWRHGPNYDDLE